MSGENHFDFTANRNGHDSPAPGNLGFNQIDLHRIEKDKTTSPEKGRNGGGDGSRTSFEGWKELTATTVTAGHPDKVTVWTRTGGQKLVIDPFVGEWTQDLGKTLLRQGQGQVLKIEADGSGGVRFIGDFSYTARFDGKPYDLKNSRNDTVTLQLVDPHTVDASYQRDGQVTQKDRWVVSADGQHMTVSTTGTLETGQRLTEKLVFKKQ